MTRPSSLIDTRVIYCGDCLDQLRKMPAECVDLIYIDPPFNSNRNYEVFWGETREKRSFEDRHESTQAYIEFMRPRCVELARVLKKTGSFYYHCDWHASHYVKVMLDQIFGENNFRNEIVWVRAKARKSERQWPRLHDSLFFYTGKEAWTWNTQTIPHGEGRPRGHDLKQDEGGLYRVSDLTANKGGGDTSYDWKSPAGGFVRPSEGRFWAFSKSNMEQFEKDGRLVYSSTGMPRLKTYVKDLAGTVIGDVWADIEGLNSAAAERLGYPTQKPLSLLERIIEASSNENDIVLDAFCGCGTALVAAQQLNRQWIGIDISPTACRVMAKRLRDVCKLPENEKLWRAGRGFVVRDLPWTEEQLRKIPPFEFENWAVIALGGVGNTAKVGDMGIDGRIYPVSAMESRRDAKEAREKKAAAAELGFMDQWYPIQVKQKDKVGRPDIDGFEAMMMREDRTKGFYVSFAFSSDAEREIGAFFKKTGKVIVPFTVREILDEQIASKLA